jgi:hypothetical protein
LRRAIADRGSRPRRSVCCRGSDPRSEPADPRSRAGGGSLHLGSTGPAGGTVAAIRDAPPPPAGGHVPRRSDRFSGSDLCDAIDLRADGCRARGALREADLGEGGPPGWSWRGRTARRGSCGFRAGTGAATTTPSRSGGSTTRRREPALPTESRSSASVSTPSPRSRDPPSKTSASASRKVGGPL